MENRLLACLTPGLWPLAPHCLSRYRGRAPGENLIWLLRAPTIRLPEESAENHLKSAAGKTGREAQPNPGWESW